MRIKVLSILLFSIASLQGQGIQDSLFNIEEVHVLGKYDLQKKQAGLSVSKLDTFLLGVASHQDLSAFLSENTHILIKEYSRGALATASFRGTAPSHTRVTWNGLSINSPMLGMVDFSLLPVWMNDQITIKHGNASISSQSGGLGGLIELNTAVDWKDLKGGKIITSAGSFHSGGSYLQFHLGNQKIISKSKIYLDGSKNDYEFINRNIAIIDSLGNLSFPVQKNEDAAYFKYGFSEEIYVKAGRNGTFSNITWLQNSQRSIPTVMSSEASIIPEFRSNLNHDSFIRNISSYSKFWEQAKLELISGFDHQSLAYNSKKLQNSDTVHIVRSFSSFSSWQNKINLDIRTARNVQMEVKASYALYSINTIDSVSTLGYKTKRNEASLFYGIYYAPSDAVQLLLQMRQDLVSEQRVPLVYAAGINYSPFNQKRFILKANLARNYHIPTLNDLYWQPGGNPDLSAEEGISSELSMIYKYKESGKGFRTVVTAYYSDINNWIVWLPGLKGYWEPFNIDHVKSRGLELHQEVVYSLGKTNIKFFGNLALTKTNRIDDAAEPLNKNTEQLPFIPLLSGNFSIHLEKNSYYLFYRNNSMSKRSILSSEAGDLKDDSEQVLGISTLVNLGEIYPHYLNSLGLGKQFHWKKLNSSLELRIENLFNEEYRSIMNHFMPGRSYYLILKTDF